MGKGIEVLLRPPAGGEAVLSGEAPGFVDGLPPGVRPDATGVVEAPGGAPGMALVLAPALASRVFLAVAVPVFVCEASLCVGLIAKGVNVERWEQASSRPARGAAVTGLD